jgi:hypothetical protein
MAFVWLLELISTWFQIGQQGCGVGLITFVD